MWNKANLQSFKKNVATSSYHTIIIMFLLAAAALMITRLFIGAGVSDEGIYLSEPYLVMNGMVPYVNGWLNASGFALWKAPATAAYISITGGTEGLLLFQRFAYLFTKTILCIGAYCLMKKTLGKWDIWLFLIPFFVVTQTIVNTSYNDLALWFTFAAGVLLYASFAQNNAVKKALLFSGLAGIAMAICAFSYPTLIFLCAAMLPIIFFAEHRYREKHFRSVFYLGGGLLASLSLTVYMLVAGGGLSNLRFGLETMLTQNAYFNLYDMNPLLLMLTQVGKALFESRFFAYAAAVSYIIALFFLCVYKKLPVQSVLRENQRRLLSIALLVGFLFFALYQIYLLFALGLRNRYYIIFVAYLLVPIFFLLLPKGDRSTPLRLLLFIWLPAGLFTAITGMSLYGILHRLFFLVAGAALFPLYVKYVFRWTESSPAAKKKYAKIKVLPLLVSVLLTGFLLGHNFLLIYGDDHPLSELDTRVSSGVYAGIYTTKERAQGLIELEDAIRSHTSKADTVLFLDLLPMAYVMTDAKPLTFSSGDVLSYYAGQPNIYDPTLYLRYCTFAGQYPTKILCSNIYWLDWSGMSIDQPGLAFNDFIKDNYVISYENREAIYPIVIYKLKSEMV